MANETLLKNNYRSMSEVLKGLDKEDISTDDALIAYRHATKSLPDVYTEDGKENTVHPIALAVANKNMTYAIKHYEPKLMKMDVDGFKKTIEETNGKKHWLLFDSKSNELIKPTTEKVTGLIKNYQQGLHKDLSAVREQNLQKADDELKL